METNKLNISTTKSEVMSFRGSAALKLHLTQLANKSGYTVAELLSILAYQAEGLVENYDGDLLLKERLKKLEKRNLLIQENLDEATEKCCRGVLAVRQIKRQLNKESIATPEFQQLFELAQNELMGSNSRIMGALRVL